MSLFEQRKLDLTELQVSLDDRLQILSVRNPAFAFGYPLAGTSSTALPTLTEIVCPDDRGLLAILHREMSGQLILRLTDACFAGTVLIGHFRRDASQPGTVWLGLTDVRNLTDAAASIKPAVQSGQIDRADMTLLQIMDLFDDPLLIKDEKGDFLLCNRAVAQLYNTSPEKMVGRHDGDFGVPAPIADEFRKSVLGIMAHGEAEIVFEDSRNAVTGELRHFRSFKKPFKDEQGNHRILVHAQDITEIVQNERRFSTVLEITREGVWDWHLPSGRLVLNKQWYRSLGLADNAPETTVATLFSAVHPDDRDRVMAMLEALAEGRTQTFWSEHRMLCMDGHSIWVQDRARVAELGVDGKPLRLVGSFVDISEQRRHKQQLEILAHYDSLTGLPNRTLLADRLQQAMAHARRQQNRLAVAYIDLDGFKQINDSHGHATGDRLLSALGSRFRRALREVDTVARLGGDEFVAVMTNLGDELDSIRFVTRLLDVASAPVELEGLTLAVSASVGVTFFPQEEDPGADQLLRQAYQAMYQAKLAGRNRYHFFDTEFDRNVRGRNEFLVRIERALMRGEFELHYQPQIQLQTGKVVGAEALIRWRHPAKGLLGPGVFLPDLERENLGVRLGEWVLDEACAQLVLWLSQGLDISVSVNVSAFHLEQPDFASRLRERLLESPVSLSGRLELEVLETSALGDSEHIENAFEACAEMGVRVALDDFGTGYCSLAYLRRLPAQVLKIDRSFVGDMMDDPDDLAILEGVVGLGNAFGRDLVAEGVETIDQGLALLLLGCEVAQGYGIARPMPVTDFEAWLSDWNPPTEWLGRKKLKASMRSGLRACVETRAGLMELERYILGLQPLLSNTDTLCLPVLRWLEGDAKHFATEPSCQALLKNLETLQASIHQVMVICEEGGDTSLLRDELAQSRNTVTRQLLDFLSQIGEVSVTHESAGYA